jgi:GT2 family glycosyltransferase
VAPAEIVLVVDHEAELARRAAERWPAVALVENPGEQGISAARNAGVDQSSGDVVAFLDDDAVAEPDWVAGLVRRYALHDSAIGVGGSIEPIWATGRPRWFPSEFGWVVGCSYTGLPERPSAVRNLIGTNMSFRREVFDTVGGFDSRLGRVSNVPVGCDETELCIRAGRQWPDREIVYDPQVRVAHNVPAGRTSRRYFVARCHAEGRSKAIVARLAGSTRALSTELGYSTRVLPAGIVAGLRDAVDGDGSGLARAAAIVLGFAATSVGFVAGWIEGARSETR